MITGKTKSGFEFEISENTLDDYDLLEALADVQSDPMKITKVIDILFGENKDKLKEHVRKEHGYVSTQAITSLVTEIFNSIKTSKN